MIDSETRFGWRKFECRLVNVTPGLKHFRRGHAVVLVRDWGGARSGDDAVLVCTDRGEPLGHLPAKCAGVIGEALDHGELYQGKLQTVGEENGRLVAYAGFNRAEDPEDVRAITKMLKRSGHAWAKFRISDRSASTAQPLPVDLVTTGSMKSGKQSSGCVSTAIWTVVFLVLGVVALTTLMMWAINP